jgi:hypothetical protein
VRRIPGEPFVERTWVDDLRVASVPWIVSRALVVGALLVSRKVADHLHVTPRPLQLHQGLLAWDAAFYRDIAAGGYAAVPKTGLRFWPLLPISSRLIDVIPKVGTGAAVLIVANAAALVYAALLHRLVQRETGDGQLARVTVWLALLAPYSVTLVMGYAESLLLALSVAMFLALRARRWELAALAGLAAGLTRPVGILLAVPALVEAMRDGRVVRSASAFRRALPVIAPAVGTAVYLAWAEHLTHDLMYPFKAHTAPGLRGPTVDPITNIGGSAADLLHGHWGAGAHVLTTLLFVALLVRLWFVLPPSYTAFAAAALVLGATGDNLGSYERYVLSAFPFFVAAAAFIDREWEERAVIALLAGGLVALGVLTFTGVFVP